MIASGLCYGIEVARRNDSGMMREHIYHLLVMEGFKVLLEIGDAIP